MKFYEKCTENKLMFLDKASNDRKKRKSFNKIKKVSFLFLDDIFLRYDDEKQMVLKEIDAIGIEGFLKKISWEILLRE